MAFYFRDTNKGLQLGRYSPNSNYLYKYDDESSATFACRTKRQELMALVKLALGFCFLLATTILAGVVLLAFTL